MTVASAVARNDYTGNGATTVYPYTFRILDAAHIAVRVNGVLKTLTTDYTVSQVNNPAGGNVTFLVAPTNSHPIIFSRDIPITQLVDLLEHGPLPAETVEMEFDKLTMIAQMVKEILADPGLTPLPNGLLSQTIIDAKGDLIAGSAADTAARLAVGAMGTWLHAKSSASLGVEWANTHDVYDIERDGGCVGDDSTDNLSALQALINAVPEGSVLHIPPKKFRVSGTLNITKPLTIRGCGPRVSYLKTTSQTATILSIDTVSPVMLHGFTLDSSVTRTAGDHVKITSTAGGSNVNQYSRFSNMSFLNAWVGVENLNCSQLWLTDCEFTTWGNTALVINSTAAPDNAGLTMLGGLFSSAATAVTFAVQIFTGGGNRFIGTGFLGAEWAVVVNWDNTADSSEIQFIGCTFAAHKTGSILVQRQGGSTKTLSEILVSACQFQNPGTSAAIALQDAAGVSWIDRVTIIGNVFALGNASTSCILIAGTSKATIAENVFDGNGLATTVGVNFGAVVTDARLGGNLFFGLATNFGGTLSTSVIVTLPTNMLGAGLPSPISDGSVIYCTNCNPTTNPCTTGGSGALAVRQNAAWRCL
jgi:hypothetical protein